jgi:predicted nuclease with TOPRIM domain
MAGEVIETMGERIAPAPYPQPKCRQCRGYIEDLVEVNGYICDLHSQLTAAQSERDEARREAKLLADDKSRLMDRIEQLERSKAAMQNRIDRLINKLEGR